MIASVGASGGDLVPANLEQRKELVEAAVDVADDVEGTVMSSTIAPERLTLD